MITFSELTSPSSQDTLFTDVYLSEILHHTYNTTVTSILKKGLLSQ